MDVLNSTKKMGRKHIAAYVVAVFHKWIPFPQEMCSVVDILKEIGSGSIKSPELSAADALGGLIRISVAVDNVDFLVERGVAATALDALDTGDDIACDAAAMLLNNLAVKAVQKGQNSLADLGVFERLVSHVEWAAGRGDRAESSSPKLRYRVGQFLCACIQNILEDNSDAADRFIRSGISASVVGLVKSVTAVSLGKPDFSDIVQCLRCALEALNYAFYFGSSSRFSSANASAVVAAGATEAAVGVITAHNAAVGKENQTSGVDSAPLCWAFRLVMLLSLEGSLSSSSGEKNKRQETLACLGVETALLESHTLLSENFFFRRGILYFIRLTLCLLHKGEQFPEKYAGHLATSRALMTQRKEGWEDWPVYAEEACEGMMNEYSVVL
jgi:hypothetical protein